jgi:uncharacterized cupredoxin-like copper-binding protein
MNKQLVPFIAFAILALSLAACGGPGTATLNVEMKEFEFVPSDLSVPAGSEVTLNLSNTGTLDHEMVIFIQGVATTPPVDEEYIQSNAFWEQELAVGAAETFTFTAPDQPGEYQVICAIPGHFEAGMKANLTVTE